MNNSFVTYPKLFIYSLCIILKITYGMSSVTSEKFDTNECQIARQSYISYYQNYEKNSTCACKKCLSRNTPKNDFGNHWRVRK